MAGRLKQVARIKSRVRRNALPIYSAIAGMSFIVALFSITLDLVYPLEDETDTLHRYKRATDNSTNSTTPAMVATTFPYIGDYPPEIFTLKQLRQGAVLLHTAGMIYMFIALAVVCDEFFVPAIEVLTEVLSLSEDVSGATFMAAGGSAPELFSSIAGLFLSKNSVGISTIIGSAVFNILFVIGMCGLFAKETLKLTWWPLFRDSIFYSISLMVLIVSFLDWKIHYYEAIALLVCYASYVTFMYFNSRIESRVKNGCCKKAKTSSNDLHNVSNSKPVGTATIVRADSKLKISIHAQAQAHSRPHSAAKLRQGLLHLMIQSIDPLGEGHIEDRAMQLKKMSDARNLTVHGLTVGNGRADQNGNKLNSDSHDSNGKFPNSIGSAGSNHSNMTSTELLPNSTTSSMAGTNNQNSPHLSADKPKRAPSAQSAWKEPVSNGIPINSNGSQRASESPEEPEEEESTPLDISWPKTHRKRCSYIFLAPIMLPLWLTLPDPRRADRRKYWPITFIGAIIWIAFFAIMMVWWASIICVTIRMPVQVIGLTVLAAGTSVPDLLTSVIVARKGFGDMAVSSSIGSNIFDITVGLPLPWLVGTIIAIPTGAFVEVDAEGLLCSIILLFCMLVIVIVSIAVFKWKMTKLMGVIYLLLYAGFVTVSVLLAYSYIPCIELKI